jgi:hypothetical protein
MSIYYHNHHIIPKHMGGSDDPSNIVKLTVEQHAEAHKKLWEEHGCWQDRVAWQTLSGQISCQVAIRQAISLTQKGRKRTAREIESVIESNKRRSGINHHYFGKKRTKEECEKMSKSHMGQIPWNKGKKMTETERQNNRNAQLKRTKYECDLCHKTISGKGNLKQHIRGKHTNTKRVVI